MNIHRLHIDDLEQFVPDATLRMLIASGAAELANAPRPLPGGHFGKWSWQGPFLQGIFYAAVAPDDEQYDWIQGEWESLANARIEFVGDDEIWSAAQAYYIQHGAPEYFSDLVGLYEQHPREAESSFENMGYPTPHIPHRRANPGRKSMEDWLSLMNRQKAIDTIRRGRLIEALRVHKVGLAYGPKKRPVVILLSPTPGRDGWRISAFDENGPFTHYEGETVEDAVEDYLYLSRAPKFSPMTEEEFTAFTQTPSFREGTKKVTYVALENLFRHRFGYGGAAGQVLRDVREAKTIDEAIEILREGKRALES